MKVLIICLTYGNRPHDILHSNLQRAGMPFEVTFVCEEGIANAMNEGLYRAEGFDAVAYLANDIVEPDNWLKIKVDAMQSVPNAGIVAIPVDGMRHSIQTQHIIGNWLVNMDVVKNIGIFNESMFPYGPIDLDYCERAILAGFGTFYVPNVVALHQAPHAVGNEYGWDKSELVRKYWPQHAEDVRGYQTGTKSLKIEKNENINQNAISGNANY